MDLMYIFGIRRLIDEYFKSNMYYLASFPFLALGSKLAGVSPVAVPISVFATLIFSSFGHGIEYEVYNYLFMNNIIYSNYNFRKQVLI